MSLILSFLSCKMEMIPPLLTSSHNCIMIKRRSSWLKSPVHKETSENIFISFCKYDYFSCVQTLLSLKSIAGFSTTKMFPFWLQARQQQRIIQIKRVTAVSDHPEINSKGNSIERFLLFSVKKNRTCLLL